MSALLFIPWFKLEGITIPGTEIGIQPFGILVAIGVLSGMRLAEWHGARLGLRRDVVSDLATHVVIIGFIFGHMFDMLLYCPEKVLERPWELLMIWTSLSSYGGFFGAAAGVLMLALFLRTDSESLADANATKNVVLGVANAVAALVFIVLIPIHWAAVIPLGIGCLIGSRLGPVIVRHAPATPLRLVIAIGGLVLAVKLGLDAYR